MNIENKNTQQKTVSKQKPMTDNFRKINKDAVIGIMRHKDGKIEKRKL